MYISTVINTIILTIGSLLATKYLDVANRITVPLILFGTITLVMNQGVMTGIKGQERVVAIMAILSLFWITLQLQFVDFRDLSFPYLFIVIGSNLFVLISFFWKTTIKKRKA